MKSNILILSIWSALIATLFALFPAKPAAACSCAEFGFEEAYAGAEAVFSGTVAAAEEQLDPHEAPGTIGRRNSVLFDVERSWKNMPQSQAVVFAGFGEASCGYDFVLGKRYLVFAYKLHENELHTSICSGTKPVSSASGDLAVLGDGEPPTFTVNLQDMWKETVWDKIEFHIKRMIILWKSDDGIALTVAASVILAVFLLIGFLMKGKRFHLLLARWMGFGASVSAVLVWIVLVFMNPYERPGSGIFLLTVCFLLLPACLAFWSAWRVSALYMFAAFIWALPLGILITSGMSPFAVYAASVFLYFVSAAWFRIAKS